MAPRALGLALHTLRALTRGNPTGVTESTTLLSCQVRPPGMLQNAGRQETGTYFSFWVQA